VGDAIYNLPSLTHLNLSNAVPKLPLVEMIGASMVRH